ncbi:glycosyltransferase family 4 protein [Paludibaculum fermentans]|uniref:Glycosyltransferase family 4 protein n=1 Tax=Paludibaculum fermentans TaxID=1473598 RepID=A0A7S7NM14_PALFE|nr:glycosyltransferase family 4 protein [Paludibaculum fermentans]QOY86044.1 glycosyltransferase family 4 protein [Paludibaculum fermentans]
MPPLNEPLNILHITARADTGGGPEVIRQLIAGSPPDLRHYVACPADPPYWDRWRTLLGAGSLIAIPRRSFHPQVLTSLVRFAGQASIHLIHAHGFGGGLYARLLAVWLGRPCLHTFHGYYPRGCSGLIHRGIENLLAPFTTAGIAVSASEAARIGIGVPLLRGRLSVVPNGVLCPQAPPARATGGPLRIVAINRLEPQKNPLALIRVADLCARRMGHAGFQLRIVGDGPLRPAVEAEIRRRGLNSEVRLLGTLPDCRQELSVASLFLSTARWEGMSLALLEAMAHGVIPVVSRVMGNVDVVEDGVNGVLFAPGDLAAAAESIRLLAQDESRRTRLALQAHAAIARRFPVSGTIGAYAALYRELTAIEQPARLSAEVHP